jgi:asparagine synthase (glutamine-hydrolysing)
MNGKTTLLAGDGGDELFGGNDRYAKQKIFGVYELLPGLLREKIVEPALLPHALDKGIPLVSKLASYVQQAKQPMPDRLYSYNFVRRSTPEAIFDPNFLTNISEESPYECMRDEYGAARTNELVDRMLFFDWKFTLADNDLRKVGRAAQAADIQVAYPFLNSTVVNMSTTIPASQKVRFLRLRHHYKRELRGFLPDKIINKTKHGFGLPFGEWLKTSEDLKTMIYPAVKNLAHRGILRDDFATDLVRLHETGHAAYYGNIIWVLFMLERWFELNASTANDD